MPYEAKDLKRERIEQIRHLATEQKVDGMLVQEWEIVALCDRALAAPLPECGTLEFWKNEAGRFQESAEAQRQLAEERLAIIVAAGLSDAPVSTSGRTYEDGLEEAAKVCVIASNEPSSLWAEQGCWSHAAEYCAGKIRSLKTVSASGASTAGRTGATAAIRSWDLLNKPNPL